jgi:hypothetical protein
MIFYNGMLILKFLLMKWALILAGIGGAVAYYMYNSLTSEQKKEMVENLKQKGKKILDEYIPNDLKTKFPVTQ